MNTIETQNVSEKTANQRTAKVDRTGGWRDIDNDVLAIHFSIEPAALWRGINLSEAANRTLESVV